VLCPHKINYLLLDIKILRCYYAHCFACRGFLRFEHKNLLSSEILCEAQGALVPLNFSLSEKFNGQERIRTSEAQVQQISSALKLP